MIQASVNVAAVHSNKRKKKEQTLNAAASEDALSERNMNMRRMDSGIDSYMRRKNAQHRLNERLESRSPAPIISNMQKLQNNENLNANESGVQLSPQKSIYQDPSRSATINIVLQQDVIELDGFDDDIPIQNFRAIEKKIGSLDRETMKNANNASGLKSHGALSQGKSQMTMKSMNAGGDVYVDGFKDFICQMSQYLLSGDIIFPNHYFKTSWDKIILILILYTAFEIPFHASFHVKFSPEFDSIVTLMFMFDIWLNFRTTYLNKNNEYILDKKIIRKRYLKTWFIIDLIASLPIDEVLLFMHVDEKIEVWFSLLRLLRVLKLGRIFSAFSALSNSIAACILLTVFLFFSHWAACAFHLLGDLHPTEGWLIEDDLVNKSYLERYVSAFYWAMSTITTIGYGDIHAISFDERLYSCAMVIISAVIYSLLLATMSLILGEIYHSESEYMVHKNKCRKYIKELLLDENLKERIDLMNRFEKQHKYQSNIEYLMRGCNLPNSIKYAILKKTLKPILFENHAFRAMSDNILLFLAENINLCVSLPNEYLYKKRDIMSKVYIIQQGLVRIFNGKDGEATTELCRLTMGAHFGELSFFKQDSDYVNDTNNFQSKLSTQSAVSHSFTVMYTISYIDFKEILLINPEIYKLFHAIAEQRNKQTKQYDDEQLCQVVTEKFC